MSAPHPRIVIIGAGPAGLMAAEKLAAAGVQADIYDAMPTPARKFLMAGKSGLNITHSDAAGQMSRQYGAAAGRMESAIRGFDSYAVRAWANGLGIETFIGSSGRVFPKTFKGSPLLRAWLGRLSAAGVRLHVRHRWTGWNADGTLAFTTPDGPVAVQADATLLALGGASWPRLGSDGAWTAALADKGVALAPFRAANCGFDVGWTELFAERNAGLPVKSVVLHFTDQRVKGDFVITRNGVEGSAIYALSAILRDAIEEDGQATLSLDLTPDRSLGMLRKSCARPRGKQSFATWLKKSLGLVGVKAALLRECLPADTLGDPEVLAATIKSVPVTLLRPRPVAEAISVAGGICFDSLDDHLMLKALPGTFAAGEMTDWEAPTGGYLLNGCMAQGVQAAKGIIDYLGIEVPETPEAPDTSEPEPTAEQD